MKKTILLLLLALGFGLSAPAQPRGVKEYLQASGAKSALYRGKMPKQYHFLYNGTYFWRGKDYEEGSIKYNGKAYGPILININAEQQELLVRFSKDVAPVALYPELVSWARMGSSLFVNLRNLGYTDAPEGYFEVVKDGPRPILLQVKKVLRQDSGNHNGTDIGYTDPHYNQKLVTFFSPSETYYTLEDGKLTKISRRAARKALKQGKGEAFLALKADAWTPPEAKYTEEPAAGDKPEGLSLPEGYFDVQKEEKHSFSVTTDVTASYRNKVYVIGSGKEGGEALLEGIVTSLETGDPLPGAMVSDEKSGTNARTDARGHYSMRLFAGQHALRFLSEAKEELTLNILLKGDGSLNVELADNMQVLQEAVVSSESMASHRTTAMGVESVNIRTVSKIPSAFGEGDIIKAVLTLPGVKTVGEASGGFNVRGGSQDQNLVLFNGNTIYNPSHLFGIFSAFNPDVVESVELYKSSIPAQYGGRISSVLTVKSKEGNPEKLKGSLGIGLLTSRAHLEGPLAKGKTHFVLGGRITYSDWILRQLPKNSAYSGGSAGFADVNAGITHRFNPRSSLQLNGYFATDRFSFSGDTTFRYRNLNFSALYKYRGDGIKADVSAGYDHYSNRLGVHNWAAGAYDLDTYIRQVFLRPGITHELGAHQLSYGLDIVGYALDPGRMAPYGSESTVVGRSLKREYALEPAAYVSDNWRVSEVFSAEAGLRLSGYAFLDPSQLYFGPEVRLSLRYSPIPNLSFKAGMNTMRQHIHLISNTASVSPMDTWKLSDGKIKPTTGLQGSAGIYWTQLDSGIDFSVEGYWKQMQNCLDYKSGATLSMNENLSDELVPVSGRAYGVEAMIKKSTGKLTGWVSYCYSRSQYRESGDRGAETLAGGAWYNAPYDKPHEVKMVANWAFTHRYSLSMNLDYSTGRPVTVPIGKYYLGGAYRLAYSQRNAYRIPDYFRLDLAVNIDPGHYKKAFVHTTFTIGVYNVTGRKNPYSVFFTTDQRGNVNGHLLSVFATPVPYVNLNLLF